MPKNTLFQRMELYANSMSQQKLPSRPGENPDKTTVNMLHDLEDLVEAARIAAMGPNYKDITKLRALLEKIGRKCDIELNSMHSNRNYFSDSNDKGNNDSWTYLSSRNGYYRNINNMVQVFTSTVENHICDNPSVMLTDAQLNEEFSKIDEENRKESLENKLGHFLTLYNNEYNKINKNTPLTLLTFAISHSFQQDIDLDLIKCLLDIYNQKNKDNNDWRNVPLRVAKSYASAYGGMYNTVVDYLNNPLKIPVLHYGDHEAPNMKKTIELITKEAKQAAADKAYNDYIADKAKRAADKAAADKAVADKAAAAKAAADKAAADKAVADKAAADKAAADKAAADKVAAEKAAADKVAADKVAADKAAADKAAADKVAAADKAAAAKAAAAKAAADKAAAEAKAAADKAAAETAVLVASLEKKLAAADKAAADKAAADKAAADKAAADKAAADKAATEKAAADKAAATEKQLADAEKAAAETKAAEAKAAADKAAADKAATDKAAADKAAADKAAADKAATDKAAADKAAADDARKRIDNVRKRIDDALAAAAKTAAEKNLVDAKQYLVNAKTTADEEVVAAAEKVVAAANKVVDAETTALETADDKKSALSLLTTLRTQNSSNPTNLTAAEAEADKAEIFAHDRNEVANKNLAAAKEDLAAAKKDLAAAEEKSSLSTPDNESSLKDSSKHPQELPTRKKPNSVTFPELKLPQFTPSTIKTDTTNKTPQNNPRNSSPKNSFK